MIEHEKTNSMTVTVVGALIAITCVIIIVNAIESARTSTLILAQLREMRGTMGEAGYLPAEPRIEARK